MIKTNDSETLNWMQEEESVSDFIQRLCSLKKELGWSWEKLQQHINNQTGYTYSEKWYRVHYQNGDFINYQKLDENTEVEENDLFRLRKERVKLSDENSQLRAYVRRISREDTLKEIANDYAQKMCTNKPLLFENKCIPVKSDANKGILLISDWHYGMICDNHWNKFDPEICKKRVSILQEKVIDLVKTENIDEITVLNLSDLIAGRIHLQIRIESRIDVVTQTMDVAEILAEFLTNLSKHCNIRYFDCLDNHSRLEPNKGDSLELETFVRMIPWYLRPRLKDNSRIEINNNEFGHDIITCKVAGHDIIGVHGHEDNPTTALDKLSLMTHKHYDLLCTAHRHHFSADEKNQTMIVSNPSLMGVDSYAEKCRLTSYPAQVFIKSTKENVCDCIYRIVLE